MSLLPNWAKITSALTMISLPRETITCELPLNKAARYVGNWNLPEIVNH